MARLARVVIPGVPYHLTHRGNRRGALFFDEADRRNDLGELGEAAVRFRLKIWGWCLMDHHVHPLAVPGDARALGEPDPLLDPEQPFAAGARDALSGRPLAWGEWLARGLAEVETVALRLATRTGRPCGGEAFVKELEARLARPLAPQKRGPKPREVQDEEFPVLFED